MVSLCTGVLTLIEMDIVVFPAGSRVSVISLTYRLGIDHADV